MLVHVLHDGLLHGGLLHSAMHRPSDRHVHRLTRDHHTVISGGGVWLILLLLLEKFW